MRPVREITADEENFRLVPVRGARIDMVARDPVEPEPVGTIVMIPFRITGYHPDCDGSLMAKMEAIQPDGEATGWTVNCIGLYPDTALVVNSAELQALFAGTAPPATP